jgi:hypothetical protein
MSVSIEMNFTADIKDPALLPWWSFSKKDTSF